MCDCDNASRAARAARCYAVEALDDAAEAEKRAKRFPVGSIQRQKAAEARTPANNAVAAAVAAEAQAALAVTAANAARTAKGQAQTAYCTAVAKSTAASRASGNAFDAYSTVVTAAAATQQKANDALAAADAAAASVSQAAAASSAVNTAAIAIAGASKACAAARALVTAQTQSIAAVQAKDAAVASKNAAVTLATQASASKTAVINAAATVTTAATAAQTAAAAAVAAGVTATTALTSANAAATAAANAKVIARQQLALAKTAADLAEAAADQVTSNRPRDRRNASKSASRSPPCRPTPPPPPPPPPRNRIVIVVRPSACVREVCKLVERKLNECGATVLASGTCERASLVSNSICDKLYEHYKQFAMDWLPSQLTLDAATSSLFNTSFGVTWEAAVAAGTVVNAQQAMTALNLSASGLCDAWDAAPGAKVTLGPYCFAVRLSASGKIVFNGFFPQLRASFIATGATCNWYSVELDESQVTWQNFGNQIIGSKDGSQAATTSLRYFVWRNWRALKLSRCPTIFDNGIDGSTGPIRAVVERCIWQNTTASNDPYYLELLDAGVSAGTIAKWLSNAYLVDSSDGNKVKCAVDASKWLQSTACVAKALALAGANASASPAPPIGHV